jgi:hypothetical protein
MLVWNWERGPFGWMDIVGLDVVRSIEDIYFEESGDTRDKAPDFLNGMIERGELGVKSGKGFYSYPNPAYEQAGWLTGECTQASDPQPEPSADSFIGTWRLISFQATAGNQLSYPMGEDAQGRLIYTRAGQMSVVLSRAQRPPLDSDDILAASMEEKAGAYDSCLSYFGAFELKNDTVVHHIEYCTFPNWVGSAQERFFHFDGNRLTLRTPPMTVQGATIVSTLVWERMEE